jgi:hypothetical protein
MARKSLNDLATQLMRIQRLGSSARVNKANAVFKRYAQNIKKSGKQILLLTEKFIINHLKKFLVPPIWVQRS